VQVLDKIWKNIFFGFIDFFNHILCIIWTLVSEGHVARPKEALTNGKSRNVQNFTKKNQNWFTNKKVRQTFYRWCIWPRWLPVVYVFPHRLPRYPYVSVCFDTDNLDIALYSVVLAQIRGHS
jgi:hypothetical protein